MKNQKNYLDSPLEIQKIIGNKAVEEIHIGMSNAQVLKILNGVQNLYLKIQKASAPCSFNHESQILQWLYGKLPVPDVIEYVKDTDYEYLVLTEIPGKNSIEAREDIRDRELVRLLAIGLQKIHALEISTCPFNERIKKKLEKAQYNLDHSLVNEEDFDKERQGFSGKTMMRRLHNSRVTENDLVFTHGDYCLPNIIIQDNQVSGFIDLARAGVSDRYNDLAIASRSVRYNLGTDYEQYFFDEYGVSQVNTEKIDYYRTMDEFF